MGAPGPLGQRDQRRPPRVLHPLHRVRARRPARPAREGAAATTRRSASGSCSTTAGTRRCGATTSSWSPTRSPIGRPRDAVERASSSTCWSCATGFDVVRFLAPMEIRGRGGVRPARVWDDDDARAYLGTDRARLPEPVHALRARTRRRATAAALIGTAEAQLHYIMDLLRADARRRASGRSRCRAGGLRRPTTAASTRPTRGWSGRTRRMETYYRNSRGRVVVTTPFRVVDFWHMTRAADLGRLRARARGAGEEVRS